MKVCKFSVCKEPTLYQSVHKNVSESLLHSLFLHETIQLSLLIYSQPPVVRHFTDWWHLLHFPWTTAFTRTFATLILWCYNFSGMIKWYDIPCATLYFIVYLTLSIAGNFTTVLPNFYQTRLSKSFGICLSAVCRMMITPVKMQWLHDLFKGRLWLIVEIFRTKDKLYQHYMSEFSLKQK